MGTSHTVRQALAQASRWTLACSLAVVSSALTSSCASVYDAYSPGTLGALDTQSLPPPDPKVPATILLEEEVVRFGEDPNGEVVARILDRSQIRIHTAAGQGYRGAAIGYSSTFSTVEAFDARITAPNGSSVVVDGAGAVDVPSLGSYVLYDDSRTRRLPVPTVAPGSVVEQASIQRMHSPELFAFAFFFGSSIAMDRGRFVVEVPQGWEIEVQSSRPEAPAAIVTTTAEGLRRYTWERTDLPRLRSDRYSPWIGELGEFVSVRLKEATRRDGTKVKGPVDDVDLSRTSAALMAKQARVTPALEVSSKRSSAIRGQPCLNANGPRGSTRGREIPSAIAPSRSASAAGCLTLLTRWNACATATAKTRRTS